MNDITRTAFYDELEKISGIGSFLRAGVKGLKGLWSSGNMGASAARHGGVTKHVGKIWSAGANKATAAGKSGFMGGLGAVARSRYGQMAAVPALAAGGLYAGSKLLGGGQRRY